MHRRFAIGAQWRLFEAPHVITYEANAMALSRFNQRAIRGQP
jgi:hypothetical protein